jgi:hypothetical protein
MEEESDKEIEERLQRQLESNRREAFVVDVGTAGVDSEVETVMDHPEEEAQIREGTPVVYYSMEDILREHVLVVTENGRNGGILSKQDLGSSSGDAQRRRQLWIDNCFKRETTIAQDLNAAPRKAYRRSGDELSANISTDAWNMVRQLAKYAGRECLSTNPQELNRFMLTEILRVHQDLMKNSKVDEKKTGILDRVKKDVIWDTKLLDASAFAAVQGGLDHWILENGASNYCKGKDYLNVLFNLIPSALARYFLVQFEGMKNRWTETQQDDATASPLDRMRFKDLDTYENAMADATSLPVVMWRQLGYLEKIFKGKVSSYEALPGQREHFPLGKVNLPLTHLFPRDQKRKDQGGKQEVRGRDREIKSTPLRGGDRYNRRSPSPRKSTRKRSRTPPRSWRVDRVQGRERDRTEKIPRRVSITPVKESDRKCFNCKEPGHYRTECTMVCCRCPRKMGAKEHQSKDCPKIEVK